MKHPRKGLHFGEKHPTFVVSHGCRWELPASPSRIRVDRWRESEPFVEVSAHVSSWEIFPCRSQRLIAGCSKALRAWLGCLVFLSISTGAQAQNYYYYTTSNAPVYYYWPAGSQGQTYWPANSGQYYQTTYAPQSYQVVTVAPQYAQPTYVDATVQTSDVRATRRCQFRTDCPGVLYDAGGTGDVRRAQTAQPTAAGGDPYGFTNWLNSTRAAYGLSAVGHDPNLSSWAAMNNDQQASRGIGHFVMGPATRQNSAMGGFPGVESMWMASPAHRAALLDPTIRWIGIAGLGAYWTFNAN